jgi:hypothetical protein
MKKDEAQLAIRSLATKGLDALPEDTPSCDPERRIHFDRVSHKLSRQRVRTGTDYRAPSLLLCR